MKPHVEDYFCGQAGLLGEVLYYHLTLEALLTQFLLSDEPEVSVKKIDRLGFAKKVEGCAEAGMLTPALRDALLAINKVRNRYAHQLGYEISFEDALALARLCGEAGVEFTDSVDRCCVNDAKALGYDTLGVLNATFRNAFFEVAFQQREEECFSFIS